MRQPAEAVPKASPERVGTLPGKLGGPGDTVLKSVDKLGASKSSLPIEEVSVDDKSIPGTIAEGEVYLSRGDYDRAISIFQEALNLHPNNKELQDKIAEARNARDAAKNIPKQ
jgi:tetratricopeptide (TPR) repeat protein